MSQQLEANTFGWAIEQAKQGKKIAREGWNGNKVPRVSPKPQHKPIERLEVVGDYVFILGSKGGVGVFDVDLLPRLNGVTKFTEGSGGYLVNSSPGDEDQVNTKLHALLFDCPEGLMVDHINGDVLDNRSENIRFVTSAQNNQNRKPTSGQFKGVSFDRSRSKWIASIQIEGATKHLGRYSEEEAAARAYDIAAYKYFGEYAWLNFPDEIRPSAMYVWLMPAATVEESWCKEPHLKQLAIDNGGTVECLATFRMKTADNKVLTGWLASQSDMVAEDWNLVDA